MRFKFIFILVFSSIITYAQSSRQVTNRYLAWGGLFGQYNFSSSWSASFDVQGRYEYTDGDWYNWLIRAGGTWKSKNLIQLSAGVAYFKLYPNPNTKPPRPEWRPWQEIGRKFINDNHTFYPRFRFEQRFIREYNPDGFNDNFSLSVFRSRFRCDYIYNFNPENNKGFLLLASEEYLINTTPGGKTYFDQNRISGGLGYKVNKHLTLQLAYLHLFLRKSNNVFEQHHIVRFNLVFQFSKPEKQKTSN